MTSPVQLTSIKMISEESNGIQFFWVYQSNANPWDPNEPPQWTAYSDDISSEIEKAFRRGGKEIYIAQRYRIDLTDFIQQNIDNRYQQRPIRRRNGQTNDESPNQLWRCERLSFPLGLACACSTTFDTHYHGLPFITDWLLSFTKGKINVTFRSIFPVLVNGLEQEGRNQYPKVTDEIIDVLNKIRDEYLKQREKIKMKALQECCAKLYTKECFIYRVVNTALRDDDRTKLNTIGPFCYLLYNYVGRRFRDWFHVPRRLREILFPTQSQSVIVYRGDHILREAIEQYKQAAGDMNRYFKWLSFVSTSLEREVAESFGCNALYIIKLDRYSSNDQYAILRSNTYMEYEEEILLRPGVRFRVEKVKFDQDLGRHLVFLKVISSYIHNIS